jgi:hypothetical protein
MHRLSLLLFVCTAAGSATTFTAYTNRAVFGGDVVTDWGALGPPHTIVPNPASVAVSPDLTVTASMELSPSFERLDEGAGLGWFGTFLPGEHLLYGGPGPIYLTFSHPVAGVGTQAELNLIFLTYTVTMDFYGVGGVFLGTVTNEGVQHVCMECGAAAFVGGKTEGADIYRVAIYTNHGAFAINQVSLQTAVPEPGAGWLCLLGVVAGGVLWQKRGSPQALTYSTPPCFRSLNATE